MTIGKVNKKDSRLFARTYKFMRKNTENLTLKDFAELIEFMNESEDRDNNEGGGQQGAAARQISRPILGLGHFLNQRNQIRLNQVRLHNQARLLNQARLNNLARLNNQVPNPAANGQRPAVTYKRNDWTAPPEPEKKMENGMPLPVQPPGGRVRVEYIEQ